MPLINDTSPPFGERTLAAVMFTDVVNFSGLISENEDRTLAAVQRDFKLMSALIDYSGGRVVKSLGDGLMTYFGSAVSAVACAQEIQFAIGAAAAAHPAESALQHRIGIHLGDVFVTEHDVLGNGVNIAARLQTRAEPGGICISQTVFDVVKNKLTLQVNYLGPQELKHIEETIPAYWVLPRQVAADADAPITVAAPAVKPAAPARPGRAGAPAIELGIRTMDSRPGTPTLEVDFHQRGGRPGSPPRRAAEEPAVLVIVGDFSGRASRGLLAPLAARRALAIDVDNFDEVFSRLGVCVNLPAYRRAGATTEITFEELEHFHPDELLRRAAPLKALSALRVALASPATAAAAAEKLRTLLSPVAPFATPEAAAELSRHVESDTETLARLLARAPGEPAPSRPAAAPTPLAGLVQGLVRASTSATQPARDMGAERSALDLELTSQLRAILRHPDFQALEAAWRGLKLLVRDFGDGATLKLLVVDVSKPELSADPAGFAALLRPLKASVVLADLFFGANVDDMALLTQLAQAAAAAGTQLLAGARPELAGCESFARAPDPDNWDIALAPEVNEAWQALRGSPAAAQVMLAAPRVLLRQPYGQWGEVIESFPFEELLPTWPHESYLWGNAAFACGHMLAAELARGGASQQNFTGGELGGLPVHRFTQDGEKTVKPCAEAWLTERAANVLEQRGVTTVFSIKGRDAARVLRMMSIAQPCRALAAPS